jgi:hypothetical protein
MRHVRSARGIACLGLVVTVSVGLYGCGGSSSSSDWKDVRSVTVTVQRPGLPPPYGLPHKTSFTTSAQLSRVTKALNAHHIKQRSSSSSANGCAGGTTIAIAIEQGSSAPVRLMAYRCANSVTGDVDGDLMGFLSTIGVSTGS